MREGRATMSITIDFSGKTVVVIGGTSGINRGIAELFASHGARVAVASRSEEKVADTVSALKALGAEAKGFAADVRELPAIEGGPCRESTAHGANSTCWSRGGGPVISPPASTACRRMHSAAWSRST